MSRTKSEDKVAAEQAAKLAKAKADQAEIALIMKDEQLAPYFTELFGNGEGLLNQLMASVVLNYYVQPDVKKAQAVRAFTNQVVDYVGLIRAKHDEYIRKNDKLSSIKLIRGGDTDKPKEVIDETLSVAERVKLEMAKLA